MRRAVVRTLRFNSIVAAAACLLLAVVVAVLWPIGYREAYVPYAGHLGVGVVKGRVSVVYNTEDLTAWPPGLLRFPLDPGDPPVDAPHAWRGFGAGVSDSGEGLAHLPAPAAILLLTGLGVALAMLAHRLKVPPDAGRCARCGYDLRASPKRCPECGSIAPA